MQALSAEGHEGLEMYSAIITFQIRSNGVRFPRIEFNPNVVHVNKVEIDGPNGYEILAKVHLDSVPSLLDARKLAEEVHLTALDPDRLPSRRAF
jgi:hypothetical protein